MSDDPQAFHFSLDSVPLPVKLAPRPTRPLPLRTLIITSSSHHRNRMIADLKGSPNELLFKIVTLGEALAGFPIGDVFVTREARQTLIESKRHREWMDVDVPMRLRPGFRIINL
jgi:hypothetical protein